MAIKVNDELTLVIQGMGSHGEGLTRVGDDEIFVPKTARGDEVRVKILEQKKGRYRSQLLELITPGANRVRPECQHFSECGGCDFQHLSYEEQIKWKMRITKHWIRRSPLARLFDAIQFEMIESPNRYGYRRRSRLQVIDGKLHFFKPHSRDVVQLSECPILADGYFNSLTKRASEIQNKKDWTTSFSNNALVEAVGTYEIARHQLSFSAACFTQGNLSVNQLMWSTIAKHVEELESRRNALDVFCGIGNFSIPLSDYFQSVTGVEIEGPSMEYARKNSERVIWREGDAASILEELLHEKKFFDFVLLDPPRMGARNVCVTLKELMPPCIIYVSCNLESLIADLVLLCATRSYKIKNWYVTDLFPQTHHIESIVVLVRQ